MADKRLVISIFDTENDADEAAAALKASRAAGVDAVGVMVLDSDGKLKTHKVGATSGGKGLVFGAVAALLGPVGLGVGMLGGGALGLMHHKNLGLEDADRERVATALKEGGAAVAVVAELRELVAVESILVEQGGQTDTRELDEAALREAVESAG